MPTQNHSLNTPEVGSSDWHTPLNENFKDIDALLHQIEQTGSRIGRKSTYVVSNTDGTIIADSTSKPTYTGSDFGTVLQSAIDELDGQQEGENGGDIHLAKGTYTIDKNVSGSVTLKTGVNIIGSQFGFNITADDGDWAYTRIETTNFSAGDDLFDCPSGDNNPENAGLGYLYINPKGTDVTIFHLLNASGTHFQNVMMEDCQGTGILAEGAKDTSAQGCQIQAGDLDNDKFSIDVIQSDRHGGQVLYNGTLDYVRTTGGNAVRIRGAGGQRAFVKGPATNSTPEAMVQIDGGDVTMSDAIVDGGKNSDLHGIRTDENITLDNVTVQKTDKGIIQSSKGSLAVYDHVQIKQTLGAGLELTGAAPQINTLRVTGAGGDGIKAGNIYPSNQWVNGQIENCSGYGINLSGIGDNSGHRMRISDFDVRGNSSGAINGLNAVVLDGLAKESANADEPQDSYRPGVCVDFTDTGDGSGTGMYRLLLDGSTWQKIG